MTDSQVSGGAAMDSAGRNEAGRAQARARNFPGIGYWTAKAAFLHPDRIALVTPEGRRTYRDLEVGVAEATSILRGLGVEAGRSFGILMWNDARFLDLLFAAGRTGGIAVPLNWRLTAVELAFQVEDAGIEMVFVGPEQEELAAELEAATGCRLVRVPDVFDGAGPAGPAGPAGSAPAAPAGPAPVPPPPMSSLPGDDDPVLMVYTSGTTGRPKGALLTHRNLFWNALNDILALGLTWQDTSLTILPLMHAGGIGLFTLPTLLAGGTVVMPRRFDPDETLELIGQEKVTVMMGVPATHGMLVDAAGWDTADLSSLRFAYNGGDRCPPAVEARFRERSILFAGGYGLTETAPTAFLTELDQADDARRLDAGAGKPSFGMDARIVDPEGRDVAPGEVGEVVLQGPNLFLGYHGRPDATAEAFRGGWFRTGDLASWTAQGFTSIAGRSKQMLKSGGENIYPAEVEQALLEHPAVAEACVIGRPHPRWNEVPFAVVALRAAPREGHDAAAVHGAPPADRAPTADDLRAFLESRLARFKIPADFAFVDALPRTSIGKPDRPLLERTFGAADPGGDAGSSSAAGDPAEATRVRNMVELFLDRVSRSGPAVALRTFPEGETITWDAWARQSAALAHRLQAAGVRPGDRVAIWAGNRPLWPLADLAALIAGAVPVGIYPSSAPVQVEALLADSGAVVALADTPERIRLLEAMRARLPSLAAVMGEAELGDAELGDAVAAAADSAPAGSEDPNTSPESAPWTDRARWPGLGADPEADAILIYTSGSTGTPRGARISHRCLMASAASIRDTLGLVEGDVALSFLPYAHAAERIFGLYTRILAGMEGVLVEDHGQVWDAARTVHPTVFGGLPRFFEKVDEALRADAAGGAAAGDGDSAPAGDGDGAPAGDTSRFFGRRLRVATSGGATLAPSVSENLARAGVAVLGAYGLTEHLCATMNRPDDHDLRTSGPPMPGTELRIADDGEILIRRGPLTFSGYLNREAETAATFTPDGAWLLTGDLGELDAQGFLKVTGRKKELLALSTGKKVAPVPIEASLVRDPWIEQAVLVGEGRKFVSALLVPSRPALEDWARRERIDAPWPALLRHPRVEARVAEIVASTNSELSRTEQVRRYHLLSEPFSQESGELTPTLKVRRGRVLERHAAEVDALYHGAEHPDAPHQAEPIPHPHGDAQ